jgi:hypothetical protein
MNADVMAVGDEGRPAGAERQATPNPKMATGDNFASMAKVEDENEQIWTDCARQW